MKNIKIISPSLHGILDYVVDVTLISVPFILNFKEVSNSVFWVPVGIGILNFLYSIFTVYSRSLVKLIPMNWHLLFDFLVGLLLFALAFILPMEGIVKLFYIIMGLGIVLATSLTSSNETNKI
jgi:hypothetical protein